ncbi:MAG: hypothetical protein PHT02_05690, partial [Tissierellia bacterium]|nr:hypothetical protein [Tissierellia bacterium]
FIIDSNSTTIRKLELPVLKRKAETLSMIKLELEQLSSINSNQTIFYKRVNNISDNLAKYVVYGLSYDLYNQYIELSQKLKLNLIAIQISSNALEKIPKLNLKINDNNYINSINAFVNIGINSINFCVVNKGINEFISSSPLNANENNDYLIDRVAEKPMGLDNAYYYIKEENLHFLIDEICKLIRYYYYTISKDIVIDKVYFYGDCSLLVGNEKYLSTMLNINVEIITSMSNIITTTLNESLNIQEYLLCILSLFIDSDDVHFLTGRNNARICKFCLGVAIMTVALFFMLYIFLNTHSYVFNNRLLNSQLNVMQSFICNEENIKLNEEIEVTKNNIVSLEKYIKNTDFLNDIINEEDFITVNKIDAIRNAKPYNTKILFVSLDNNYINMQCKSYYLEDMMLFISNLRNVNFISDIYVPDVSLKQEDNFEYSYSVICNLGDLDE